MSDNPNIDASIKVAAVCRALSDPFRLHAFVLLMGRKASASRSLGPDIPMPEAVDEIAYALNISPEVVEHHIMELARADLVTIVDNLGGCPMLAVNTDLLELTRRHIDGPRTDEP